MEMARTALATPRKWWDRLDEHFEFTLDAAADHQHFMCTPYFTEEDDALSQDWKGRVWCSPPWLSEGLYAWVNKGHGDAMIGVAKVVVMLLPIRPHSDWWHDFVIYADQIWFLTGHLDFVPFDERVVKYNVEAHCLVVFSKIGSEQRTKLVSYPA